MHVLIVGTDPSYMVQFRSTLIERLRRDGCRVTVACWPPTAAREKQLRRAGADAVFPIEFSQSQLNPLDNAMLAVRLYLLSRRLRCQAVLCFTAKPVVAGMLAAWLAGVPHRVALVEGLGFAFTEGQGWKRKLARTLLRGAYWFALRCATARVVLNADDLTELATLTGLNPGGFHLLPGIGVEERYFVCSPVPTDPIRFLYVGRMLRDKGVVELLEAAALLRERGAPFELCLAGALDANPSCVPRPLLDALLVRSGAQWAGHAQDVPRLLEESSVVILPSYREGFPRVVMEAMAAGRAVIATDVPGCRAAVRPGETGLLVSPRDAAALASAMQAFLQNKHLAHTLGVAAREYAKRHFRAEERAAELAGLLYRDGRPFPNAHRQSAIL